MSVPQTPPSASLNILHVIASMAPEAGGPPVVCAGLAAALARRGHALTIATVNAPGESHISIPPTVRLQSFPRDGSPRYARSSALAAWLEANIKSFDIAHLHSLWQFPTYAAAKACREHRVPYVTLLHGMLDRYSVRQNSFCLKCAYWLYRERGIHANAAGIHVLNRAEIRRAVPWIKAFPKFVVGNGIGAEELGALPARGLFRAAHPHLADRPLALFLSRIHPKKGLDRLIPAWRKLAARLPRAALVIAGAGNDLYVAQIDRLIKENGLEQHVFRVGQLTGEKKWQALVDADVFVLPSHQEGFSMAITEALAVGCPPIVTEECNFDELEETTPKAGIIIRNGDMAAFISAVETLLNDPAARAAMAAAGQSLVQSRYTWEKIAAEIEMVYRAIIAGKPLPHSA